MHEFLVDPVPPALPSMATACDRETRALQETSQLGTMVQAARDFTAVLTSPPHRDHFSPRANTTCDITSTRYVPRARRCPLTAAENSRRVPKTFGTVGRAHSVPRIRPPGSENDAGTVRATFVRTAAGTDRSARQTRGPAPGSCTSRPSAPSSAGIPTIQSSPETTPLFETNIHESDRAGVHWHRRRTGRGASYSEAAVRLRPAACARRFIPTGGPRSLPDRDCPTS